MRRLLAALLLLPAGCGTPPVPAAPVALTERVIAAAAEEHLGQAFAAHSASVHDGSEPDAIGAAVYYRATATARRWSVRVTHTKCCWGECTRKDGVITSYLRSSDETYPTHVRMVRPIEGGHLVVEEVALGVDWGDRPFPVPLAVLREILFDPRIAFTADPALNTARERLAICWRLLDYSGE